MSSSQQQRQQQHQPPPPSLPVPSSPPFPPGVQPTRIQWLRRDYGDPSHALALSSSSSSSSSSSASASASSVSTQPHVLYWMQRSVRSSHNHALETAIHHANHLRLPLLVVMAFVKTYPGANERGFAFFLEGLSEVQALLARRGISMVVREAKDGSVAQTVLDTARRVRAPLLVTDRGYERLLRAWRREVAAGSPCPVLQVESDVVVPVETVSPRALASTASFRQAQAQHLAAHLVPLPEGAVHCPSVCKGEGAGGGGDGGGGLELPDELDVTDPGALLASLDAIDRCVGGGRKGLGLGLVVGMVVNGSPPPSSVVLPCIHSRCHHHRLAALRHSANQPTNQPTNQIPTFFVTTNKQVRAPRPLQARGPRAGQRHPRAFLTGPPQRLQHTPQRGPLAAPVLPLPLPPLWPHLPAPGGAQGG
jgi:hypothetical protein